MLHYAAGEAHASPSVGACFSLCISRATVETWPLGLLNAPEMTGSQYKSILNRTEMRRRQCTQRKSLSRQCTNSVQ